MKKIIIIMLIALTTASIAFAQNDIDALRYSQLFYGGTARSTAMGGAFGALGADFSSLSLNPAGIGLYKISEFTITPSFYTGKTTSQFNNSPERDDFKYNFNLGNTGFVYTFYQRGKFAETSGFKSAQFAFGVNRLNNFNNRMVMEGFNESSSMLRQFVNDANTFRPADLNSFSTQLAYDAYLINPLVTDSTKYTSVVNKGVLQHKTVSSSGSTNEMVISLGGNYSDKLYIGATLGFPFIRYAEQSTYKESGSKDSTNFNSFTVNDDLQTSGSGINFKFGLIYRPIDMIRIGVAFHSPTYYYAMHDEYSRRIESDLVSIGKHIANSPKGSFDYELTTPLRVIGSLALVLNEYGLISADYEFVDYTEPRLRADSYDFYDENNAIQTKYTSTSNVRVGTEWRLNQLSFRAGYAFYGSPYRKSVNDAKRNVISAGIGFREKDFFVDLAYSYSKQSEDYYFYDPSITLLNPVKNSLTASSIMMTIGFKY